MTTIRDAINTSPISRTKKKLENTEPEVRSDHPNTEKSGGSNQLEKHLGKAREELNAMSEIDNTLIQKIKEGIKENKEINLSDLAEAMIKFYR
ncbi:hypothetical protein SK355_06490 [Candidatus Fukatsuia symbiotica]|uniref:hypothetical protein n=1 Tax=Candidatus Fukatsuia TaxID=1927833 RepID=UPI0009325F2F|nr:hypothetical protein [Candidatus Fukatsuia symbiotica]MEA9444925.1 hypothetical protein [Candidatus Fukatsuia symbiotica]